jgi:DNA polymerase III subunit gamma/tau
LTYEPLHHKYRPQTFAELVGQDAIATTLANAICQQRIAHAYLFTGPRGTGKTSSARILAKSLNCIQGDAPTDHPCGICDVCRSIVQGSALDVIEIDAASNTGVDNIRELIERSQFAPVQCRYKVYVIDECHMLSTAAFNALLKTLEEPPPQVVFVLATTDPQRVLPTIISRCQRFDFRRIALESMAQHLSAIALKEQIEITPESIQLIAQLAQGGLRDAESLLDQLSLLSGQITLEAVWDLVGAVPEQSLLKLVHAIAQANPEAILDCARELMDRGREPLVVLQNLAGFYRDMLIAKTAPIRQDLVAITPPTWINVCELVQSLSLGDILAGQQHLRSAEVQIKNTTQPRLWLEVTLLGLLSSLPATKLPQSLPITSSQSQLPTVLPVTPPQPPSPQPPSPQQTQVAPAPLAHPSPQTTAIAPPAEAPLASPAETVESPLQEQTQLPPQIPQPAPEPEVVNLPDQVTPAPSASESSALDLAETWNTVMAQVQPYSSQVLVRQQCRLLAFKGQQARIGVTTQQLLKIAQAKLPNIETAFEVVFQRKVKVSLEVISPSDLAATPTTQPSSPPSNSVEPFALPPEHPNHQGGVNSPSHAPHIASPPVEPLGIPPQVQPPSFVGTSPAALPENLVGAASPTQSVEPLITLDSGWHQDDEVTKAAKSLAVFFRGKVVDLGDDLETDRSIDGDTFQATWEETIPDNEELAL